MLRILAITGSLTIAAMGAYAQAPAITSGGVVNAATFDATEPIAPGSLVSIFGTELALSPAVADTIPLSTMLSGTSVTFTGPGGTFDAPLLYVSATQANVEVPWELLPSGMASASVSVVVTRDGAMSPPASVTVGPDSPGIFASGGRGIAVNYPDNELAWPTGAVTGVASHPAKAGGALIIYCTGLGALDSAVADGQNSQGQVINTAVAPAVLIGGQAAQVLFSGLSPQFVGVYQLNVIVPSGVAPGDSVPLQLQMNGLTTPAAASPIAISQ